jgi:2-polyprenyl-3-methyl-5-hydroxy-6-metoxy-1,4-benzoquinol methylase
MKFLIPSRQFNQDLPELMDIANPDPGILRQDLGNLRIINRWFGGLRAVRRHTTGLISKIDHAHTIQVLDLATGSADHPISLVRMARSLNRKIRITAVERNPLTLSIARERSAKYPEIVIEEGDLLNLHYPPKSFDIVLCSLAIHHFSTNDAVKILKMMIEYSRVGLIVNDLYRSWPAAWTAWIYTHLTTRNPMTLNDSYVSVLRAFTPQELRGMAGEAGVPDPRIFSHPMFRLVLIGEH